METGNKLDLIVGDKIQLNEKARGWTQGLTFKVTEIRHWGVICYHGPVGYRAPWEHIEKRASAEVAQSATQMEKS